jgi:hypothetical protein
VFVDDLNLLDDMREGRQLPPMSRTISLTAFCPLTRVSQGFVLLEVKVTWHKDVNRIVVVSLSRVCV